MNHSVHIIPELYYTISSFDTRQSERRFLLFGVCCVDAMAMSACRYFRVTAGRAGTGR